MKRFTVSTSLTAFLSLWAAAIFGAVPQLINFQGILRDGSGNPVVNASYSVTFKIYDAPSGGTLLWTEAQSVGTTGGLFTVLLGSATVGGIPNAVLNDSSRYLGITVSPDPEMTPRQKLVSVGYGYRVGTVDGASGGTITSKVSIGPGHTNTGTDAFVAGANNTVGGDYSAVGGGQSNNAGSNNATIAGGASNGASSPYATVGGGSSNTASNPNATVGGGGSNTAGGFYATVGGGLGNSAGGFGAAVGGGRANAASGDSSTVGGGSHNGAGGVNAAVVGGLLNGASNDYATVGGGVNDSASGFASTVPGGRLNKAAGGYAFAAGYRAKANDAGSFVWGDGTDADFASTGVNQFLIRASGGVGIGTNAPDALLHVKNLTDNGAIVRIGGNSTELIEKKIRFGDGDFVSIGESGVIDDRLEIKAAAVGIGTNTANSKLQVSGAIATAVTTTAANLTLNDGHSVVLCNNGAPITISLPTAVGIAGRQYTIKAYGAFAPITIDANGGEGIDGSLTYSLLASNKYVVIVSDGANWVVVGNN